MMQERRASNNLSTDLLLQILEQQRKDSETLHEMKGNVVSRVDKLEKDSGRQWWMSYVVTPVFFVISATARHFGVKV